MEFLFLTPQHANNTRDPEFTPPPTRLATERCGGRSARPETPVTTPLRTRPAPRRANRDGSNGTKVRAASVFAGAEPKGRTYRLYRTYRLSNVSVALMTASRTCIPSDACVPRWGPVAWCPACPRVARKRHAWQTRDEVEDVRPCGCPARHTGPHRRSRHELMSHRACGASRTPMRARRNISTARRPKLMSCPESPPKVLQFTCYSL